MQCAGTSSASHVNAQFDRKLQLQAGMNLYSNCTPSRRSGWQYTQALLGTEPLVTFIRLPTCDAAFPILRLNELAKQALQHLKVSIELAPGVFVEPSPHFTDGEAQDGRAD